MMKVKCIDTKHYVHISLEKVYEVYYEDLNGNYYLKDDSEDGFFYTKDCFMVLCETEEGYELENKIVLLEKEIKAKKEELNKLVKHRNELNRKGVL